MRRRCPCSLGGCGPPGLPPCAYARAAARPPRGSGPGPSGGKAPTPGPHAPAPTALRKKGMWAAASLAPLPVGSGVCGRFFATSRAAVPLRLRLRPSPASGGGPRPRYRCSGVAVAGPLGVPPPCALGPCAPLCGSVAARCRPCAAASPLCAAGALIGCPCFPRGLAAQAPPFLSAPGLFFVLGCCAPCAFPPVGGVLPCAPPVPAAPAGGSGEAPSPAGGLRPPCRFAARLPRGLGRCPAVRFPIVAAAGKGLAGQLAALALAAALFLAQGLDNCEHMRYSVLAEPARVRKHSTRKGVR